MNILLLTPLVQIDAYMCHTFKCMGCKLTDICIILCTMRLNASGADWHMLMQLLFSYLFFCNKNFHKCSS